MPTVTTRRLLGFGAWCLTCLAEAGIHTAPIILPARIIRAVQYHPINMYRVFRTGPDGSAIPIPFQIDERDHYGDFILPKGKNPNTQFSNGIFDGIDELSIMGNDVGPVKQPTKWAFKKPAILYQLLLTKGKQRGAIYVGAYFTSPPPLSPARYVSFNLRNAEIRTSKYRYLFDNDNYLVVRGVDILSKKAPVQSLLESSTFYLKTDFKYFITLEINQGDISSELDAYMVGPIRAIARVNFNYSVLKLNFDLGMYTEVSFFSNSVILPAIIDNPLDGPKTLNEGSEFYYGFNLRQNPKNLTIETNMPAYRQKSFFDFLNSKKNVSKDKYWVTAKTDDYMVYLEMIPSKQMQADGAIPSFFLEQTDTEVINKRSRDPAPLGEARVNMAVAFGLQRLQKGFHEIALQLFVENTARQDYLDAYKELNQWKIRTTRVRQTH